MLGEYNIHKWDLMEWCCHESEKTAVLLQYNSEVRRGRLCYRSGCSNRAVQVLPEEKLSSKVCSETVRFLSDKTGRNTVPTSQLINARLTVYMEDYLLEQSLKSPVSRLRDGTEEKKKLGLDTNLELAQVKTARLSTVILLGLDHTQV